MEIFNKFKLKPISKNIVIIDSGNTSMKYLDPENNIGIMKTARVRILKNDLETTKVDRNKDYFVKIEKLFNGNYKECGTFLFGHAAVSDYRYEDIQLGNEKYKDPLQIYQLITITLDKARSNEPVELRTMLPYTQIGYKEIYKKNIIGHYRITFLNRNEVIENEIKDVKVAVEGSYSLRIELKRLLSSKVIKDGSASFYARKIVCMFDIGGGQTDIPAVIVEKDMYGGYYEKKIQSFSTNFGMHYIATLLLQELEKKNINTTMNEVINSIVNYKNIILLPSGKEYDFTKELNTSVIEGFKEIMKKYMENLRAQNINSQIGLVFLSGGGAISFSKALNEVIANKGPESKYYNFEVRSVIEPVYHNVLSLRGED
jgi:hypothetical protein